MRRSSVLVMVLLAVARLHPQGVTLEYRVKAGYLFNFVKFVEWPAAARSTSLVICVAGRNPFGEVLTETLRGEKVHDFALAARVIVMPETGCHVVFVPQGVATTPWLRATRGSPTLTVGEDPGFIAQGGIVNFIVEAGSIRFQINPQAADRAELRISSHLLRLARLPDGSTPR